jgi:hypothetical protein
MPDLEKRAQPAFINKAQLRQICREEGITRIESDAEEYLTGWLRRRIRAACQVHDGSSKSLTITRLAHSGIR